MSIVCFFIKYFANVSTIKYSNQVFFMKERFYPHCIFLLLFENATKNELKMLKKNKMEGRRKKSRTQKKLNRWKNVSWWEKTFLIHSFLFLKNGAKIKKCCFKQEII